MSRQLTVSFLCKKGINGCWSRTGTPCKGIIAGPNSSELIRIIFWFVVCYYAGVIGTVDMMFD